EHVGGEQLDVRSEQDCLLAVPSVTTRFS
ncbi:hypothetical protein A2U01_0110257, partial [Trifolium medium]|nr:hypothetical protein [Trifolium medium]